MKTNKSKMIRDAIRAAGEPVTVDYLVATTGFKRGIVSGCISTMCRRQNVFIAGTAATYQKPGHGNRDRHYTYELSEFAGEC